MPTQTRPARIRPVARAADDSASSASSVVRTQRALETLRLLQSGQAWTASELADRFRCSSRTIFRDVQLLRECGIPVETPPGERGFRLAHDFFWKPVRPTLDELIALVVGVRLATDALPNGLARRLESAMTKVVSAAQPAVREQLNELTQRIDAPHRVRRLKLPDTPLVPQILEAIVSRSPIRLRVLEPKGATAIFEVMALQLTIVDEQWHLVGAACEGGEHHSIPLSRMESIEPAAQGSAPTAKPLQSTSSSVSAEHD